MTRITEIYQHYHTPESLQWHQLRVAAVATQIVGMESPCVTASLLHDLGNLVKFDLSENARVIDPSLHTPFWREKQKEIKARYGTNSHQATTAMLKEMRVPEPIIELVRGIDASTIASLTESSLEQQICEYADLRVTPRGVVSLEERLEDLRERYHSKRHIEWATDTAFEKTKQHAQQVEEHIQKQTGVDVASISSETVQPYLVELRQAEVPAQLP